MCSSYDFSFHLFSNVSNHALDNCVLVCVSVEDVCNFGQLHFFVLRTVCRMLFLLPPRLHTNVSRGISRRACILALRRYAMSFAFISSSVHVASLTIQFMNNFSGSIFRLNCFVSHSTSHSCDHFLPLSVVGFSLSWYVSSKEKWTLIKSFSLMQKWLRKLKLGSAWFVEMIV